MVSSDFVNRVTAYPLVSSAYQRATAGIAWAKDRSAAARAAVDLAESGLRRVANGASPLLSRYETRIADLDRLACRQLLDRLETTCPTVLQPTEKVVERGRNYYSEAVKPKVEFVLSPVTTTVAKVQSAKSASLERYRQAVASRQGQSGLRQLDQLIQLLSDCVDKCLPPVTAEKETSASEPASKSHDRDEARKDAGTAEKSQDEEAAPADPARSIGLVYELGRKVSHRVSDQVVDKATRLAGAGHRLVDRLLGHSSSDPSVASTSASSDSSVASTSASSDSHVASTAASSDSHVASTAASSESSSRPPAADQSADGDAVEENPLDSSDESTN